MSVRPPASTSTSGGGRARRAGTPPPLPPKSPTRSNSISGSLSRRRGDGSLMSLNMPKPLGALAPATPTTAESVNGSETHLPLRSSQLPQQQRPVSPLRLKPKPQKVMFKRESSISKFNNLLKQSRSFRRSSVVAPVSPGGTRKRQPVTKLTRRDSERLRSILKPTQPVLFDERADVASNTGKGNGQSQASTEKRQSRRKIRSILKTTQATDESNSSLPPEVPSKDIRNQSSATEKSGAHTKGDSSAKSNISEKPDDSKPKSVRLSALPSGKEKKNNKEILSRLERERRKIRRQNSDYFHSRVWDPALERDFAGAYRLANEREELESSVEQTKQKSPVVNPQPTERASFLTLVEPQGKAKGSENKEGRFPVNTSEEEWGHSVRLAMARLETKITTEATANPAAFMQARRESAQLRAWVASRKRTSEARLSALAMGRVRPNSPFEQAFVAELLRENEVMVKHSSNPLAEAERLFRNSSSSRSTLLPHYTPFSQYPLLTPLEEIEADTKQEQEQAAGESRQRRRSVFEDMKTARRAGKEYKTLSISAEKDLDEGYAVQCCGLSWKSKKKRVISKEK